MGEQARVVMNDLAVIPNFDPSGDAASMGFRWTRWLLSFELFLDGKGVTNVDQKKALLLQCAGVSVQDIYYTFEVRQPGEGETVYSVVKAQFDAYFKPQVNVAYERSVFRGMSQLQGETAEQYITRLRQKAVYCEFGGTVNEMLRDQVVEKCYSHRLRRKLLEKTNLTLTNVQDIARAMEFSDKQAHMIEAKVNPPSNHEPKQFVNKVQHRNMKPPPVYCKSKSDNTCWKCGYEGHFKGDNACPARDKKCRKCGKIGHFEKCCKTKFVQNYDKPRKGNSSSRNFRRPQVRQVYDTEYDSDGYAFSITHGQTTNDITIQIGEIPVSFVIDSGASVNIIDRSLWEYLKSAEISCKSKKTSKKLFAYGSDTSLTVAGSFTTDISYEDKSLQEVEFYVIEEKGQALLGKETAMSLGVLHIGITENVHVVKDTKTQLLQKYPKCFNGIDTKGIYLHPLQIHCRVCKDTKADGNCIFNSISISLYGNQDHASYLRMASAIHMADKIIDYTKYILKEFKENTMVWITAKCDHDRSSFANANFGHGEAVEHSCKEEILAFLRNPYRECTLLHLHMVSDMVARPIVNHYSIKHNLQQPFGKYLFPPLNDVKHPAPIHLVWVPSKPNSRWVIKKKTKVK